MRNRRAFSAEKELAISYYHVAATPLWRNQAICRVVFVCIALFLRFCVGARAQGEPFLGKNKYPQFRQLSGLSGDGYGLDEEGRRSSGGATAFSTPIAYVLGHDQIQLGVSSESFTSAPAFGIGVANGKGVIAYGHTFGQFNIMASDLLKSHDLDQAYSLQVGITPAKHQRLAFAVGAQDVTGTGGSAGAGLPTDRSSSRSLFAVTTYRTEAWRHPLYLSAGIGTHRFAQAFASASSQLARPLRTWLEYDGWGFNEGILLTGHAGRGRAKTEFNGTLALIRGRYFTMAVGVGF